MSNWKKILLATIIIPAIACLSACATRVIDKKLSNLNGSSIGLLIDKLGPPTSESNVAGRHFYVWTHSEAERGNLYQCSVEVQVGDNNQIINWQGGGQQGGCQYFADRLM